MGATGTALECGNQGFYSTVSKAYNHHYVLKTCPEDWWFCITQKVGLAIDDNANKDEVRKFFVQHEGKKTLTVQVGSGIYGVNYSWFFDQMVKEIERNINVPEYVSIMEADFSETTSVQRIVNKVLLMTSMQEYFDYRMDSKCGIPGVIMKGSEADWDKLSIKLKQLEDLLKPIEKSLGLDGWWAGCSEVCSKLLKTFQGYPDEDWWSKIVNVESFGSGPTYVSGWFVQDFLGLRSGKAKDVQSGLVAVPLIITDGGITEVSAVVAGIAGLNINAEEVPCEKSGGFYPSVEAVHSWALMLEPDALLRKDLVDWQEKSIGA